MRTKALKQEINELRTKIDKEFATFEGKEMPDDVVNQIDSWNTELSQKIDAYKEAAEKEKVANDNRQAMRQLFAGEGKSEPTNDGNRNPLERKAQSIGEQVLNDPEFKQWLNSIAPDGRVPSRDRKLGVSPAVDIKQFMNPETKALVTGLSDTSAGAFVTPDRANILIPALRDDLGILDLITFMSTESDTIEYVQVTSETNAAAETAEATAITDGTKPESAVAMAVKTAIIETIAHWIPITKRALADARQIRAYIENFLLYGLQARLASQLINGTGVTPNIMGIANVSGVQAQAFATDVLTTTRKARTLVRLNSDTAPTAYVMNPQDWEAIDLTKDSNGAYYFGGPLRLGTPTLWGLPVVENEDVPVGTAYLGDWRQLIVWDREQASIQMSDSHSDFFIKNLVALLAEMRVGSGVLRPAAFVEIDLTAV